MAALLPRASLLPRSITSNAAAPPCTTPALTRLFSSTPSAALQQIPPESPLFINVPNPPQDQSIEAKREQKRVRGFIPVPRRIFAHRDAPKKRTDAWLARAAPKGTNARSKEDPASELEAWRREMADSRRENLRTGIRDLWARNQRIDARHKAARSARLAANKADSLAPEPEDERLTRGTVNAGTLQTTVLPDPLRFERGLASAARTATIAADKSEARCDALQTLYMNARSFIVSEDELEAAVNHEFADDHFEKMGQSVAGFRIQNIWDAQNEPMSIADMLKDLQRDHETLVSDMTTEETRTVRRQKKVAEELTGGKMDG
ncbi:hypothetical protein F4859DRAFT_518368 [Xylaria cf. heliscus]|nr:hypothetical protein F4859DRAFT_518368 [Xylaria cf. heliscus]